MNRDQAVSFGDPMPMRLGKALTKEELEKRAIEKAVAPGAGVDASSTWDPPVLPTWAVERAEQAWCAPATSGIVMSERLAWEFARILAVDAGALAPRAGEMAEDHGRQVRKLSAHAAAYGTGVLVGGGPLHESTDAMRWATAFSGLFSVSLSNGLPAGDDTQGLMLGWFANAIEAGRTAGLRQAQSAAAAKPAGEWPFPEHGVPVGLHE